MRKTFIKLYILLFFIIISINLKSQFVNTQYNIKNDSLECLTNISVYKEFQRMNIIDKAIPAWRTTYQSCKGFRKIVYQDGVKFIKSAIENEKNPKQKEILVDSLMQIYNERIRYFGEEGFIKGKQGMDLFRYNKLRSKESLTMLNRALELEKNETEPAVLVMLMAVSENLVQKKEMPKELVVENFLKTNEILDFQKNREKDLKQIKTIDAAIMAIENIFSKSNSSDCESIAMVYNEKFNTAKDDLEQVLKIQSLLKGASCTNGDLFLKVSLQVQKLQPSSSNANLLASIYAKNEKYTEAIDYLKQASDLETIDSLKANFIYDIAAISCYKLKQYQQARSYAYEAIKYKQNWGFPYVLIGDAYAMSSAITGTNKFENATAFWAAVDKYYKAKTIDQSVTATADEKIAYYSKYFPNSEDAFFNGLADGKEYTVGGWINENTVVRTKK